MGSGGLAHLLLTSALDGGECGPPRPCPYTAGKEPPTPSVWEAGWAPEPIWMLWKGEVLLPLPSIGPRILDNPAHIRYTDLAIPAPICSVYLETSVYLLRPTVYLSMQSVPRITHITFSETKIYG
jgi:hypothetical protein